MKNLRYALLTLAVLLAATAVRAQETKVKADIPFDFIAGDGCGNRGPVWQRRHFFQTGPACHPLESLGEELDQLAVNIPGA